MRQEKRISRTTFGKKMIPIFLVISYTTIFICIVFLDFPLMKVLPLICISLIFSLGWLLTMRKLKTVYLGDNYIVVDEKKLNFEKIVSIKRFNFNTYYSVEYLENNDIKSFVFSPNTPIFLPFLEPYYVKKIKEYNYQATKH